jgi:hypothetical protein
MPGGIFIARPLKAAIKINTYVGFSPIYSLLLTEDFLLCLTSTTIPVMSNNNTMTCPTLVNVLPCVYDFGSCFPHFLKSSAETPDFTGLCFWVGCPGGNFGDVFKKKEE